MIGVHRLQDAVDLVFAVLATSFEPAGDVREKSQAAIPRGGDRLEATVPEERGELRWPIERRAPCVVAFRSLHPCDDTRAVPLPPPNYPGILIVEVGPRDGLQAEDRILSTDDKVELINRLADAGHHAIEVTSFVSPKAVPQLADADDLMRRLGRRSGVRYSALVPNEKGLDRALALGIEEIAVFASASESYSRRNLNRGREEVISSFQPIIRRAKDGGMRVRAYLSMIFADPWDGPTPTNVVVDMGRRLFDFGCDELSLGDTIGVGTPGEVVTLTNAFTDADVEVDDLAFHFHDTYGQALANAYAAMSEGVTVFDASVGGIGGSPFAKMAGGNLATEDLVWMCRGMNIETGIDLEKLVATSHWLGEQLGRELPARVSRALRAPPR